MLLISVVGVMKRLKNYNLQIGKLLQGKYIYNLKPNL